MAKNNERETLFHLERIHSIISTLLGCGETPKFNKIGPNLIGVWKKGQRFEILVKWSSFSRVTSMYEDVFVYKINK